MHFLYIVGFFFSSSQYDVEWQANIEDVFEREVPFTFGVVLFASRPQGVIKSEKWQRIHAKQNMM